MISSLPLPIFCPNLHPQFELRVCHGSHKKFNDKAKLLQSKHYVVVDSGTAGVFDYESFHGKKNKYTSDEWVDYLIEQNDKQNTKKPYKPTLLEDYGAFTSGFVGDGIYPIYYSKNRTGEITQLKIVFNIHIWLNNK